MSCLVEKTAVSEWDKKVLTHVLSAAKGKDSLEDFLLERPREYQIAKNRGILNRIARSMKRGVTPKPCRVYYIRFCFTDCFGHEYEAFKIGITTQAIKNRYRPDMLDNVKMDVLYEIEFPSVTEAYEFEQNIIQEHRDKKYHGPKFLRGTGTSEMFSEDIKPKHIRHRSSTTTDRKS